MGSVNVAIACTAGLVLVMSLVARRLRRSILAEPTLALAAGVAVGPAGLAWLTLEGEQRIVLEQTARFTLALILVSVGLGLPRRYLRNEWASLSVLTLGTMAMTWVVSTLLVSWVLGWGAVPSLLVGAVLAPLDPVLAAGVTVGKFAEREVPSALRHNLAVESAASHGLGYLLVLLPAYLMTHDPATAWRTWSLHVLAWDGLAAVVIGALGGTLVGRIHRYSLRHGWSGAGPLFTVLVALALATVAAMQLAGSAGLLALVVAAVAYARGRTPVAGASLEAEHRHYETTFKQILQVPVFVLLGVALPWGAWVELGWAGVVLVILVLALRRLPAVFALRPLVPPLRRWEAAAFVGWFGSAGVGALHFALLAEAHTGFEPAWEVGSLVIVTSTVAHDLTVYPLTRWLHRRMEPGSEGTATSGSSSS